MALKWIGLQPACDGARASGGGRNLREVGNPAEEFVEVFDQPQAILPHRGVFRHHHDVIQEAMDEPGTKKWITDNQMSC